MPVKIITICLLALSLSVRAGALDPAGTKAPFPGSGTIVIPRSALPTEEFAAALLADYLPKITGGSYPVIRDDKPVTGPIISVGNTTQYRAAGLAGTDVNEVGYRLEVRDGDWFITGGKRSGPVNGVLALLEEDFGVRWYAPGLAPVIPPRDRPEAVPRCYSPQLLIRDIFSWVPINHPEWSGLNRTNPFYVGSVPPEFGGNIATAPPYFCHTLHLFAPAAECGQSHPELFPLIDGKRVISDSVQRCFTNPELVNLTVNKLREEIAANPGWKVFSISQEDYPDGWCECPACMELYRREGSWSGPLLYFINAVARRMAETNPDVLISTLAYVKTFQPPKTLAPEPNVLIMLCNDSHATVASGEYCVSYFTIRDTGTFYDALRKWAATKAKLLIWDYTLDFNNPALPQPDFDVQEANIDDYVANGAVGIFAQADYVGFGSPMEALKAWVLAKKFWDPRRRMEDLAGEFISGYYGQAAPEMQHYFDLQREWSRRLAAGHRPKEMVIVPLEFADAAIPIVEAALKHAENDEIARRVELELYSLRYLEAYLGADNADPAFFDELEAQAKKLGIVVFNEARTDRIGEMRRQSQNRRSQSTPGSIVLQFLRATGNSVWDGDAIRLSDRGLEAAVRNFSQVPDARREYLVKLRFRVHPGDRTGRTPLFVLGSYSHGQLDSEHRSTEVTGSLTGEWQEVVAARVRFIKEPVFIHAFFYVDKLTPSPVEAIDFARAELIPADEYSGPVPSDLPLLEFGLRR